MDMFGILRSLALALLFCAPAAAETLRIGMSGPITTIDPHFYNISQNNMAAFHVFDTLTQRSPEGRVQPDLALFWRALDDTSWEFKLRPGVKWQDGTDFTAQDVAFTLERARNVAGNLGGFENLVRPIVKVDILDPLTLRLVTRSPTPNLPMDLTSLAIISEHAGRGATTADYASGKAMVGTGPYRFVSFTPGDRLVLARNEAWWGPKQPWDRVELRIMTNIASRTAALLSGDVDIIEQPAAQDLPRLRKDPALAVIAVPGSRIAYINPVYQPGEGTEPITTKNGSPIAPNPLLQLKVRRALSLGINRQAIADRILLGTGIPTGQWAPVGAFSYDPTIPAPPYDPVAAKALLTEAGYPDGFKLTLSTATDRTPYAVETVQAIAQMWTRIGIQTAVDGMPYAIYSSRGFRHQFQIYFGTLTVSSMEAGTLIRNLLMAPDKETGTGILNWSVYSDPALDALDTQALSTIDDAKREALLRQAVHLVLDNQAFIPVYYMQNIWAFRRTITYDARVDELTLATGIHPAK